MIVIGAGMSGLLAAAMLRADCEYVYEAQSGLPNNHSAVLRFRSSVVSDILNIPFKKVKVLKGVAGWRNPVADAMAYSIKTNGTATLRSILDGGSDVVDRYIAPPDLVERMYNVVKDKVNFSTVLSRDDLMAMERIETWPAISTMPMPALMKILGWNPIPDFHSVAGVNIIIELNPSLVDVYCSLYVPDPSFIGSRISITGSSMVVECIDPTGTSTNFLQGDEGRQKEVVQQSMRLMGLPQCFAQTYQLKQQRFAKIIPTNEEIRKRFIMWASEKHQVYSLGRFATWRPGLLLDDVVNDVRVIHRIMNDGSLSYLYKK